MATEHFDVIIIGTGAGGGTLAHRLAPTGKKVLVLERGTFLPREKQNWDTNEVFKHDRYHTKEVWLDKKGNDLHPGTGYWVGGNTKVYGAALLRLRERDFEQVVHKGGISPEWPIKYHDLAPYYDEAERMYNVHGQRGEDPTEPPSTVPYPHAAVSHELRIQEIYDRLKQMGHQPFHVPLGIKLNEQDRLNSPCVRCDTCDGFPCLVDGKADSDINAIRPSLSKSNIKLVTSAKVTKLITSASGREIKEVEVERNGELTRYSANIVVVSCGAVNSAALLLRSASDKYPNGLANSSDQVGRNFMKHTNGAIVGISTKKHNFTVFQKTMGFNDFYWGEKDFPHPMGHVQLLGKVNADMMAIDAPPIAPGMVLEEMASRSVDWWLTAEDLPDANNRVTLRGDQIVLNYTDNNLEAYERLVKRWSWMLKEVDCGCHIYPSSLYLKKKIPLQGVAHQCGTVRFGKNPKTSVLDTNCETHDVANLYVVDGSFFPSSAAVNPSLTIMANALRVGDHLKERLR